MVRTVKVYRVNSREEVEAIRKNNTGYTVVDDFDASMSQSEYDALDKEANLLIVTSGWRPVEHYAKFYHLASGCVPGLKEFKTSVNFNKRKWRLPIEIVVSMMIWPDFGVDSAEWPPAQAYEVTAVEHNPAIDVSTALHTAKGRSLVIGERGDLEHVLTNIKDFYEESGDKISWYHKIDNARDKSRVVLVDIKKRLTGVKLSGFKVYSILGKESQNRGSHVINSILGTTPITVFG